MIHMKYQARYSQKNKEKNKLPFVTILSGTLRVKKRLQPTTDVFMDKKENFMYLFG